MPSLVLCTGFEHALNLRGSRAIPVSSTPTRSTVVGHRSCQMARSGPVRMAMSWQQAAGIIYGVASGAAKYANLGGPVVAGRDNYQGEAFKDVLAAGGTVLS